MRIRVLALLAGLFVLPMSMRADTVYTYTGGSFTGFFNEGTSPSFTSSDYISGEFTVSSPLAANLVYERVEGASSFVFGDRFQSTYKAVDGELTVSTDANGNIIGWNMLFDFPSGWIYSSTTGDSASTETTTGAFAYGPPGVWTMSTTTPEPSTFVLIGTGLAGALGMARRKFLRQS